MPGQVIRFSDYERREPDAVQPRDPADACVIIVLPMIRQLSDRQREIREWIRACQ